MIYTLTISPSIDYINKIDKFTLGKINRSTESFYQPGGKGINVSLVLKEFGVDSIALGFVAGFTGEYLEKRLNEKNIKTDFIKTSGLTRINVKIESDKETAINTDTLKISDTDVLALKAKLFSLTKDDMLVISGNITKDLNKTLYADLISSINSDVKVVVDATDELLTNTLKYKPFLIKPNREELEEMFNIKIKNIGDCIIYMKKLQEMGARNVIVSLDKDGALLLDENNNDYYLNSIDGDVLSTVGAGDSLIAGFIAGVEQGFDYKHAFLLAVAAGNATAFSYTLATNEEINDMIKLIKIKNR